MSVVRDVIRDPVCVLRTPTSAVADEAVEALERAGFPALSDVGLEEDVLLDADDGLVDADESDGVADDGDDGEVDADHLVHMVWTSASVGAEACAHLRAAGFSAELESDSVPGKPWAEAAKRWIVVGGVVFFALWLVGVAVMFLVL